MVVDGADGRVPQSVSQDRMNDIPRPSQLPATVDKPIAALAKVSDADLDSACASLGLIRFKAKTLRALKIIGGALEASDMAHVQAASIVITQEKLQSLLTRLEAIADGADEDDTQSRVEAIRAATAVCGELNRSCELAVKILETKLLEKQVETSRKYRGLSPGEQVLPITVNIKADGDVKVDTHEAT